MKQTILIGGAPCAGKSTVAAALMKHRGGLVLSADEFREDFRLRHQHEALRYPWIFLTSGISAEDFWKNRTVGQGIDVEVEQEKEMWPELTKQIAMGHYGVVEGVSIMPEQVAQTFDHQLPVFFLIDTNRRRVRESIYARGLWGEPDSYSDVIKEKEVDWVMAFNRYLAHEAKKYSYSVIPVGDRGTLMMRVRRVLESLV